MSSNAPTQGLDAQGVIAGLGAIRQARQQRVLGAVLVVLLCMSLAYGWVGSRMTAWSLFAASVMLLPSYEFNRHGKVYLAADWMLWVLLFAIGALALNGQGLRDTALLAYPGLLVFAIMLWRNRTMMALLVGQLGVVGLIWWLDASGVFPSRVTPSRAMQIVDIGVIIGLTAYASLLIATDQRKYLLALAQENTRVTQALAQLDHSTRHDVLTGLPNRRSATAALQALCQYEGARQLPAAVTLVNLDHFKSVNESLGPQVGDDYLVSLSRRLQGVLVPGEAIFRIGSDEFLMLSQQVAGVAQALERGADWTQQVALPINQSGVDISITASAGLALFPMDGSTPKELLMHADMAMLRAKEAGRNTVRRFDGAMGQETDHLKMLADLRKALQDGGFALHYQPKIDLRTGALCGAEALLRWRHETRGFVSPAVFVPLAEKSGFIAELGTWVLQAACRQVSDWLRAGWCVPPVAVNVSMVQFRKGDLDERVSQALAAVNLQGPQIELELTESLLSDSHGAVQATLARIRRLGVTLAIDDFGTGYSNLGYLKQFEIQTLKIDQSFVRRLGTAQQDQAIVKAIVNMASQLGLKTVAEGVESAEVAAALQAFGCDIGQGYLWSPALPAADFAARYLAAPAAAPGV